MHPRSPLCAALAAASISLSALSALVQPAGATPQQLIDPTFDWHFEKIDSDGVGGVLPPEDAEPPGQQVGGELSEQAILDFGTRPNLEAFSNAAGTTFWTDARSPAGPTDLRGTPLGGRSTFTVTQTFQVTDENATLSFTISQIELEALDPPRGPGNEGLTGYLSFDVVALDPNDQPFFHFLDETELRGEGLDWHVDDLTGPLQTQIVQGGTNQSNIRVHLTSPFTQAIDLSSFDPRDLFTVKYTIVAEAIDTEQFDSHISARARDPLVPDAGSFFEYTGLVPIASAAVPEPGTALLLLGGLTGLASFGSGRRRGPGRC